MRVIVLMNKADCLPAQYNENRLRSLIRELVLDEEEKEVGERLMDHYLIVSAKTSHNLPKLAKYLEKLKENN